MKPYLISNTTDTNLRPTEPPAPGSRAPEGSRVMYLPRIRCIDCPGKVYTTLPLSMVEDFEKHLKNRLHRERVQERKRTGTSSR